MVTVSPGTQKKIKGYGLILEDTILFAEGGGQVSFYESDFKLTVG